MKYYEHDKPTLLIVGQKRTKVTYPNIKQNQYKGQLVKYQDKNNKIEHYYVWTGICLLGKYNDVGKLVLELDSTSHNKFEYDIGENTMYRRYFNGIQKINLNEKKTTTLFELNLPTDLESIALDWVTKNIYVVHDDSVKIVNVRDTTKSPKTLWSFGRGKHAAKIKVFPNAGYLFVYISGE